MDRIVRLRGALVLLAAALVLTGLSAATAAKKPLTKKKADSRYVNVGEKASDADLLDGTDSSGFLGADDQATDSELFDGRDSSAFEELGHSYCDLVQEPENHAPCNTFITTVDNPANNVGVWASIAIGTDGNPVISYQDFSAKALKVAACNDPVCAGANETITTVEDPANVVGESSSIAIGTDGNPVIAYRDTSAGAVKVAKCNDPACAGSNETVTTVDDTANILGFNISIAIGTDGNPVISYYDGSASALWVAKCNDVACAGVNETITLVDNSGSVGQFSSLAIGTDGNPVISYYDSTAEALKVAKCNDPACAGANETLTIVDDPANDVGLSTSIAIGADGSPVISYYDTTADSLKVAKCNDPACAGASLTTLDDPATDVGQPSSIVIGTDGNPVIGYSDRTAGILKVARCNDPACAGGNDSLTIVDDPANDVGASISITIGTDGNPVIGYYDETAGALKVARIPA